MSSTNTGRRYLSIAARILLLLIVAIGVMQSGHAAAYIDPYGFLFILVGGIALWMISFPAPEIWRAFRLAAGSPGNDAELRKSAHFGEAAGRGFWILGGLHCVLSILIGFAGIRTMEFVGLSVLIPILIRPLLSTFYGSLLAVICFIPCSENTHGRRDARKGVRVAKLEYEAFTDGLPAIRHPYNFHASPGAP